MKRLLDVLGARGELSADDPGVAAELERDFAAFAAAAGAPDFRVAARVGPVPADPLGGARGRRWRDVRFADEGAQRLLDYGGRAWGRLDLDAASAELVSPDPALLRELAYLAACSFIGRRLDEQGRHRVHALGAERGGAAGLLLLPEGGGKSTVAFELLRSGLARLYSDDSPVLAPDGLLHAFPMRLGLRPDVAAPDVPAALVRDFPRRRHGLKRLVDWSWVGEKAAPPAPPRALVVGRPGGTRCVARRASAAAALPLLEGLVVGVGLPQAAEFLWPRGLAGWASVAALAARRAAAAARLLRGCRVWVLEMGPDPAESARVFAALITDAVE